ncbi:Putative alpha/beta hydrolase-1, epoxide hydrolase [Septoria linicola]|uniref:Alpha/beta hydrolase-1, epoxide hydrolase n=1 Tax=Septoria linicola TaxID=215465 RepID=A0A9Q9AMS0_9PEZI|nr:Putative alpha/beta hydrolase-1, epoxide hydrolase [Septoria linicola]
MFAQILTFLLLMASAIAQSCQSQEGFVENDGVRTHFRAQGSGDLLLLVHGFPDNADSFYHQVPELAKHYTVVTPTLRGFPPSDVPADDDAYVLSNVVGDLVALIKHFNARQVILGGHDFGGAAVQLLALSQPDLVAGMILFNAPILPKFTELVNFDAEQQKASEYTIHFQQYQIGDDKEVENKTAFIRNPTRRKEIEEYLTASPINGMMAYYKKNYPAPPYGQTSPLQNASFAVPTLIVWGVEDEYFIPKMVDGIPKIFPGSARLVTFPSAGHWAFQDEPKRVNREMSSWLGELKLGA